MIFRNSPHYFLKFLNVLDRRLASTLIWLILNLRPLLGPGDVCPFVIGCTNFAVIALETNVTPVATVLISKRLLRCNPIGLWVQSKCNRA